MHSKQSPALTFPIHSLHTVALPFFTRLTRRGYRHCGWLRKQMESGRKDRQLVEQTRSQSKIIGLKHKTKPALPDYAITCNLIYHDFPFSERRLASSSQHTSHEAQTLHPDSGARLASRSARDNVTGCASKLSDTKLCLQLVAALRQCWSSSDLSLRTCSTLHLPRVVVSHNILAGHRSVAHDNSLVSSTTTLSSLAPTTS
jgi:hypothetical protein